MATEIFDNAKKNKADEFYTQLKDIEQELRHYKEDFKGKTILCNCDDPYESNFFKYFAMNFNYLGLKKLIATCYDGSPVAENELSLLSLLEGKNTERNAYKIEITEIPDANGDGAVDLSDVQYLLKTNKNVLSKLDGDGDFRSAECVELLKEADIIVTNPPFSLFREFIDLLETNNKKFVVIGNTNALTYKEVFCLFKDNKIRTGYTNFNVGMYFFVPDDSQNYHKIISDKKMVRVSTSCWLTNLAVEKHNVFLTSYKNYSTEDYPKFDNYDAININKYIDIPADYYDNMGVPVTFLDKYNPKQFELIDALNRYALLDVANTNEKVRSMKSHTCYINGKSTYFRIVIKRRIV